MLISLKEGLLHALTIDIADRRMRMRRLFDPVNYYNINFWGEEFSKEIESVHYEIETSGYAIA